MSTVRHKRLLIGNEKIFYGAENGNKFRRLKINVFPIVTMGQCLTKSKGWDIVLKFPPFFPPFFAQKNPSGLRRERRAIDSEFYHCSSAIFLRIQEQPPKALTLANSASVKRT